MRLAPGAPDFRRSIPPTNKVASVSCVIVRSGVTILAAVLVIVSCATQGCGDESPQAGTKNGGTVNASIGAISSAPFAVDPHDPAPPDADTWPRFRGDMALRGVSPSRLPARLAPRWVFEPDRDVQSIIATPPARENRIAAPPTSSPPASTARAFTAPADDQSSSREAAVKSSAVIANGRVFVGHGNGRVYALDLKRGKKFWEFKTEGEVEAAPLVVGDTVFIGSADMWFYALDAETGELRWKHETQGKIAGGANAWRSADGKSTRVLFGSYDSKLYCLDARTGDEIWTHTTDNYINGTPAIADGLAAFGGCDGKMHLVEIETGASREPIEVNAYLAGSPALDKGQIFTGHYGNEVICLAVADAGTDKRKWTYKSRDFPYFSSPALSQTLVVIGGRDRRLHAINRGDGKLAWDFRTRGQVDSSPVIVGDKVVFGSNDGRLYVVSIRDGAEVWSYEIGKDVIASPAVASGMIVVGCEDGRVYAFGAED